MEHVLQILSLYFTAFLTISVAAPIETVISRNSSKLFAPEPCSIKSSFLFTKEDAEPGSPLLQLSTYHGETWTLKESGPEGYLQLDMSSANQTVIIFGRSPDIEEISNFSGRRQESLPFTLECTYNGWVYKFMQELIIHDVNEHPPVFDVNRSYNISISEATTVGGRVFSLRHIAHDPDVTGRVASYSLSPYYDSQFDGRRFFKISSDGNHVILLKPIDYDFYQPLGQTQFKLNLTATDNGSPEPLSSHAILTIHVTDADDQGPAFVYEECPMIDNHCAVPYFQTMIKCAFEGLLRLYPGPILAQDKDTLNNSVWYSITRVEPKQYEDNFEINALTGDVKVVKSSCASSVSEILLAITATENSTSQHSISTTLQVDLLDNYVGPNKLWNTNKDMEDDNTQHLDASLKSPRDSTVPLTLFLLSICGFVTIGSVLAFLAVRISRSRRSNKIEASTSSSAEEGGECQLCKDEIQSSSTCFRACSMKMNDALSSKGTDTLRSKFHAYTPHIGESSSDEDFKPLQTVADFHHEFRTSTDPPSTNPFYLTDTTQFRPTPIVPGRADTSAFHDTRVGSMKHERRSVIRREAESPKPSKESAAHDAGFKQKLNSMVPEFFKPNNLRVRFDTSNLKP